MRQQKNTTVQQHVCGKVKLTPEFSDFTTWNPPRHNCDLSPELACAHYFSNSEQTETDLTFLLLFALSIWFSDWFCILSSRKLQKTPTVFFLEQMWQKSWNQSQKNAVVSEKWCKMLKYLSRTEQNSNTALKAVSKSRGGDWESPAAAWCAQQRGSPAEEGRGVTGGKERGKEKKKNMGKVKEPREGEVGWGGAPADDGGLMKRGGCSILKRCCAWHCSPGCGEGNSSI